MPIENDNESRLSNDSRIVQVEPEVESSECEEPKVSTLSASLTGTRTCPQCGQGLLPYGYRGVYGWSHAEKACNPLWEQWDRWSLEWAGKLNPTNGGIGWTASDGSGGYRPERYVDTRDCRVLIRGASPTRGADVGMLESEYGPRVVWLWEAASKSIFLNSDGYLRVHGKGTVISTATCPVVLDFGPGFMIRTGLGVDAVSQVAHVLEHKLVNDNLYIKFRWLTHDNFVKELYECPDKFFGLTASLPTSTISSAPPATVGLAQPR